MLDWITIATAGVFPLILKYGLGVSVAVAAVAFAYFSPVFKKTALWVAVAALAFTFIYGQGVKDGASRIKQQVEAAQDALIRKSTEGRIDAERSVNDAGDSGVSNDDFNRDRGH